MTTPLRFFATCAKGTEGALRRELSALKLKAVRGDRGGVSFEGPLEAGMRACLHARTAMRVLLELSRFPAPTAEALLAALPLALLASAVAVLKANAEDKVAYALACQRQKGELHEWPI